MDEDRIRKALAEVHDAPGSEVGARRIRSYGTDYQRALLDLYEELQWMSSQNDTP